MTSQTITNSSLLTELTKKYEDDLAALSESLDLPEDYWFAISHDSDDGYSLTINHLDDDNEADFLEDVVTGTPQQVTDFIKRLQALRHIERAAELHQGVRAEEKMALDSTQQPQEWHSHYESLDKPKLVRPLTPGWVFEADGMFASDGVTIFRSQEPDFGMEFTVIDRPDGTQEISFQTGNLDWIVDDAAEILELSDKTDRFQVWLGDCAVIAQWVKDNAKAATK